MKGFTNGLLLGSCIVVLFLAADSAKVRGPPSSADQTQAKKSGSVNCVGSFSAGPCSVSCGGGVQTMTYVITTPSSGGGTKCPHKAGYQMTQTCDTNPCPVNCSGYFTNTSCSVSCGGGTENGTFIITTPAANGGANCTYANGTTVQFACNTNPCPISICDQSMTPNTAFTGILTDGSGPNADYINGLGCGFLIAAPQYYKVSITFSAFCLANDNADSLALYDGADASAYNIESIWNCPSSPPNPVSSSLNNLYLYFSTDNQNTGPGFTLQWNIVDGTYSICDIYGGSIFFSSGPSGYLSDGPLGQDYGNNAYCQRTVQAPTIYKVTVSFDQFCLANDGFDVLHLYDGLDTTGTPLGDFYGCPGTLPGPLTTTTNGLTAFFRTDNANTAAGFILEYSMHP